MVLIRFSVICVCFLFSFTAQAQYGPTLDSLIEYAASTVKLDHSYLERHFFTLPYVDELGYGGREGAIQPYAFCESRLADTLFYTLLQFADQNHDGRTMAVVHDSVQVHYLIIFSTVVDSLPPVLRYTSAQFPRVLENYYHTYGGRINIDTLTEDYFRPTIIMSSGGCGYSGVGTPRQSDKTFLASVDINQIITDLAALNPQTRAWGAVSAARLLLLNKELPSGMMDLLKLILADDTMVYVCQGCNIGYIPMSSWVISELRISSREELFELLQRD